jgi:hypothetical protein
MGLFRTDRNRVGCGTSVMTREGCSDLIMKGFIKFIFVLAILGAIGYFAWPYVKPYIGEFVSEEIIEKPVEKPVGEEPGRASQPKTKVSVVVRDKAALKVEAAKSEVDLLVEELYPMPDIKPLEELVGNWREIPERVFPREVVVKVPVELKLVSAPGAGGSKMDVGERLVALSGAGGVLAVAPTPDAAVRGEVAVDDTDLKEVLGQVYDDFVVNRTEKVLAQRDAERVRIEKEREKAEAAGQSWVASSGYADGSGPEFAAMKASIGRGEAGDRSLAEAKGWRWIGPDWVKGTQYDAGLVRFEVSTIFGVFKNELKALHENGKVVRWVYPATNETLRY